MFAEDFLIVIVCDTRCNIARNYLFVVFCYYFVDGVMFT